MTTREERRGIVSDYLVLLGPFIGLVLAGLALVIGLLSDRYLRLLAESRDGVITFLRPFIITIGIQIGALLGAVAFRSAVDDARLRIEQIAFVALSFLFVYGVLEVVAITRNLNAHALLRAEQVATEDVEARVRPLPKRQNG